jgi:type IV pilus assembly protein PilF
VLGLVYQGLREFAKAEQAFARAVEIDPRDSYALNAYGSLLCDQGRPADAAPYFQRAVDNPLYPTPWIPLANAGLCATRSGANAQAVTDFRRALAAKPNHPPALFGMAEALYEGGDYPGARDYLLRFREAGQPNAESLWLGSKIERALDNASAALDYETALLQRFPDSIQAQKLKQR